MLIDLSNKGYIPDHHYLEFVCGEETAKMQMGVLRDMNRFYPSNRIEQIKALRSVQYGEFRMSLLFAKRINDWFNENKN